MKFLGGGGKLDLGGGYPRAPPPLYETLLKRTSESDTKLSYLDISISICSSKYVTEVYDKRDAFNFTIVNFPYMSI